MVERSELEALKVLELKERLAAKGLPTTGVKAELVDRLFLASMPSTQDQTLEGDMNDAEETRSVTLAISMI
jgi:hypothetical protein